MGRCSVCCLLLYFRTVEDAKNPMTSQTNRRHLTAVLQVMLVTSFFVISFVPLYIFMFGIFRNKLFLSLYYINHVSNFFIYLAVNSEFRNEVKLMLNALMKRVRPNAPSMFTVQ